MIPEVDDYWELAWMIQAPFKLPWWVSGLHDVENYYLAPPAPKCLARNMFLPDNLSYQDVRQQPLLLTMAYAQVLQSLVEKFRLPVHLDCCPLAKSIVELMHVVKNHILFYK